MSRHHSENCKVYVGDLPKDASEKELERVFREYGSLRSVWVARNPPGFAFVEFDDERDAEDAVKSLDGSKICGVQARVKHSTDKPPRQRPPTRRPYDPNDRCYKCNKRGHYAYDCDKYAGGSRHRSYSRSRSRSYERRRKSDSRSRSRSPSRGGRRRRSPSRSRSRS